MARKIGFIGVGNMANAIIGGMTSKGGVPFTDIVLYDCLVDKCASFAALGATVGQSEADVATAADVIVLAVKPQNFPELLATLSTVADINRKVIVTIAAGITVETVSSALHNAPVVRVLPNTPMLIGMGVSVICRSDVVARDDFDFVVSMFEASGRVMLIDEGEMNRIISVTSSSPAYVFAFIKAICDGAAAQGLSGSEILPAVCDVVIGSALLLKQGAKSPEEQISVVTSKGGTTERAMAVLQEQDLYGMIEEAMKACTRRAEELSGHQAD